MKTDTIDIIRSLPLQRGKCRGCDADIEWVTTAGGRLMPVNHPLSIVRVHERSDGVLVTVIPVKSSHFFSCPNTADFRTRKGS